MKKVLWRIFPPIELTATKSNATSFVMAHTVATRDAVLNRIFHLLNDTERTVYSIRCDHLKPQHLALLLVSNVTSTMLQTGQYHTYRGVLNAQGSELLNLFILSVEFMLEGGFTSAEETEKDHQWILQQIREVG